jgi:hypothetical protein
MLCDTPVAAAGGSAKLRTLNVRRLNLGSPVSLSASSVRSSAEQMLDCRRDLERGDSMPATEGRVDSTPHRYKASQTQARAGP